jgi:hypothetical protein
MPLFRRQGESGSRGEPARPSNPDTPPDSADPSGPCPRCGRIANFTEIGSVPITFGGGYSMGPSGQQVPNALDRATALLCNGCNQGIVVVEEEWVGDHPAREGIRGGGTITWRGVHWWPPPSSADLDDSIPPALRSAFAEGQRALGSHAPRAAVVMFRVTLEALVQDRGSDAARAAAKRNLAAALKVMADEGALDRSIAEWAAEVRVVGNVGAHFDAGEPVEQSEAEDLGRLLRQLLAYVYELPAKIRRTRESGR